MSLLESQSSLLSRAGRLPVVSFSLAYHRVLCVCSAAGSRGGSEGGLLQPGPGLHGRLPRLCAGRGLWGVCAPQCGGSQEDSVWRSHGPAHYTRTTGEGPSGTPSSLRRSSFSHLADCQEVILKVVNIDLMNKVVVKKNVIKQHYCKITLSNQHCTTAAETATLAFNAYAIPVTDLIIRLVFTPLILKHWFTSSANIDGSQVWKLDILFEFQFSFS